MSCLVLSCLVLSYPIYILSDVLSYNLTQSCLVWWRPCRQASIHPTRTTTLKLRRTGTSSLKTKRCDVVIMYSSVHLPAQCSYWPCRRFHTHQAFCCGAVSCLSSMQQNAACCCAPTRPRNAHAPSYGGKGGCAPEERRRRRNAGKKWPRWVHSAGVFALNVQF